MFLFATVLQNSVADLSEPRSQLDDLCQVERLSHLCFIRGTSASVALLRCIPVERMDVVISCCGEFLLRVDMQLQEGN